LLHFDQTSKIEGYNNHEDSKQVYPVSTHVFVSTFASLLLGSTGHGRLGLLTRPAATATANQLEISNWAAAEKSRQKKKQQYLVLQQQ